MVLVDIAVLVGAFSIVTAGGYAAWRVGNWLGDFTYDRWNNRRRFRA